MISKRTKFKPKLMLNTSIVKTANQYKNSPQKCFESKEEDTYNNNRNILNVLERKTYSVPIKILPNLYLGSCDATRNLEQILDKNITTILNLAPEVEKPNWYETDHWIKITNSHYVTRISKEQLDKINPTLGNISVEQQQQQQQQNRNSYTLPPTPPLSEDDEVVLDSLNIQNTNNIRSCEEKNSRKCSSNQSDNDTIENVIYSDQDSYDSTSSYNHQYYSSNSISQENANRNSLLLSSKMESFDISKENSLNSITTTTSTSSTVASVDFDVMTTTTEPQNTTYSPSSTASSQHTMVFSPITTLPPNNFMNYRLQSQSKSQKIKELSINTMITSQSSQYIDTLSPQPPQPETPFMDTISSAYPPETPYMDTITSAFPPETPYMDTITSAFPPETPYMDTMTSAFPPDTPYMDTFSSYIPLPETPFKDTFTELPPETPFKDTFTDLPPDTPFKDTFTELPPETPFKDTFTELPLEFMDTFDGKTLMNEDTTTTTTTTTTTLEHPQPKQRNSITFIQQQNFINSPLINNIKLTSSSTPPMSMLENSLSKLYEKKKNRKDMSSLSLSSSSSTSSPSTSSPSHSNIEIHYHHQAWEHNQKDTQEKLVKAFDIIDAKRLVDQQSILVSCQQGVSRSATLVIAYVMKCKQWGLMKSYDYVKEKCPWIAPNITLMNELSTFEHYLIKQKQIQEQEKNQTQDKSQNRNENEKNEDIQKKRQSLRNSILQQFSIQDIPSGIGILS